MASDVGSPGATTSTLPNVPTERPLNNSAIKIGVGVGVGVSLLTILVCLLLYIFHIRKGRTAGQKVEREAETRGGSDFIPKDHHNNDWRELDTRPPSRPPYVKPEMSAEARIRANELPALRGTELPNRHIHPSTP
ncbi:MAG: hypothetical protein Q9182_001822 [Xanthomendoza sp. 2 TL-2023]